MAITRTKKEEIINKLKDIIKSAKTIVFVRFHGVTSEEANSLRTTCQNEDVKYMVAKKTLIKKVFSDAKIELPILDGEIAISYGEDILSPARVMGDTSKKLGGRIAIVGGMFDGKVVDGEKMREIASIPEIKTLYVQFLTVIHSPIQGFVSTLNEIVKKKD